MTNSALELERGVHVLVHEQYRVRRGESVVVTADTSTDPALIEAMLRILDAAGAKPVIARIPRLPFQGTLADPYIAEPVKTAVCSCDVWFDATFPSFIGSGTCDAALKGGRVRYMLLGDLGRSVGRIFGRVDFDSLFALQGAMDTYLAKFEGEKCRITNPGGSDFEFTIGKPATQKRRIMDKSGSQTPPGSAIMFPIPESVKGVVALDAAFDEYYRHLRTPLVMEVDGRIRTLKGDGEDVKVMDRALRRAGSGEYGYLIHFTYGFHPAARFAGESFIEDIRATGSNAIGLGIPWWVPGGGENHPDGVVKNQSVWIAGQQLVRDGLLLHPADLAKLAAELTPRYGNSE